MTDAAPAAGPAATLALTDEQTRAIEHRGSRLQILACAGSGKTEVLARRAVRLLREGVDPASIVAFTFTDKAALELKARVERRAAEVDPAFAELPPAGRGMFIGTTHAWALDALHGLGAYETADGLTEAGEWALLRRFAWRLGIVDLYRATTGQPEGATGRAIEAFLRSAEVVHNERIDRATLLARAPAFARVLERYEWLLGEMKLLPFRLMIARAIDELEPGGRLRERLAGRIRHVLVDEFQDFNRAQDRLLGLLAELGAEITAVGDDDQAIYQWRGGDVSLFVDFAARYQGERVVLGRNHRCRPGIVRFARHVVEALPTGERLPKILDAAREEAEPGAVEVASYPTAEAEAEGIAGRIEELIRDGHRPGDVAVLYRSVRTSAAPLVAALRKRNIPVAVVGKTSLLARPEMALLARIFVLWAGDGQTGIWYPNPEPEPETVTREAIQRAIEAITGMSPARSAQVMAALDALRARILKDGVGDVVHLFDEILATLELPGSDDEAHFRELGLGRLSELLVEFDGAVRRAAPPDLYRGGVPFGAQLAAEEVRGPLGERRAAEGLAGWGDGGRDEADEDAVLADSAAVLADVPSALGRGSPAGPVRILGRTRGEIYLLRLKAFLETFASRAAEETPDPPKTALEAVQIMTVHQAKGLEFPIVFVPALVERRFPSARLGEPRLWYVPDELFDRRRYEGREEDEARLLYVALTRARELLVVSWFEQHRRLRARPSRFVTKHLRPALAGALRAGRARPPVVPRPESPELLDLEFGSLETYRECGYRYWLRHVCGFRAPRAPELGFGRFLHHLVAELARSALGGRQPNETDVDRVVERDFYLPFAGPIPATLLRESARRRGHAYVRRHADELTRAIRPEVGFEVPIAGARVRGRIDLLLRADGVGGQVAGDGGEGGEGAGDGRVLGDDGRRVELVDFKTAANRPPSEIHQNQLRIYALAAERLGFEPVRLWIHDLDTEGGGRIEVANDPTERERFRDRLGDWVDGIRSGRFEPAARLDVCLGCDFRGFCRYAPPGAREQGGVGESRA
ncbi:MAG TPA: ATP-dependent DNA helicase [Candidatus Binatia bacterium]|nr:ATP-dependent DNA helicase [Candidatus Binatia bacterium]